MKLEDPITIRGVTIRNRLVMEPMFLFSFPGEGGSFYSEAHLRHYAARAEGGAGLIILQSADVAGAARGAGRWTQADRLLLGRIAQSCRAAGAAVMIQLACPEADVNALTAEEIRLMQRDLIQAALTACALGFDGVEFHFAHGFTLCRFLDAKENRRADAYGGSPARRAAILTEILPRIRERARPDFILGVRMGAFQPESADGVAAAQVFEKAGVDLLNISHGMTPPAGPVPAGFPCGPMTWSARQIKRAVALPVIAVGGIRTGEQAQAVVEGGCADFAGIGRGMLTDPAFANHVLAGEPVNPCRGCRDCLWSTDHTKCPGVRALAAGRPDRAGGDARRRERRDHHDPE